MSDEAWAEVSQRLERDLAASERVRRQLAEALGKTIYNPPGWTGPDVWWADEARAALAASDALDEEQA